MTNALRSDKNINPIWNSLGKMRTWLGFLKIVFFKNFIGLFVFKLNQHEQKMMNHFFLTDLNRVVDIGTY